MSTESKPTEIADAPTPRANLSRWSLRRLIRFRLRTLLLLTVAAAFYTQWSLRPKPETEQFGDYQVFHHRVTAPTDQGYAPDFQVEDGAYWITDKQGRLLVRGAFDKGTPTGTWRTYHPNGRLASVGSCGESGARQGVWKSYYANGRRMQRIAYGASRQANSHPHFDMARNSVREGPAEGWHENGQLHWRGRFQDDVQDGEWEFYDEDGTVIAHGPYRSGRRHGRWQIVETAGTTRSAYYIFGRKVPDPKQVDEAKLDQWMAGDVQRQRLDAIDLAAHTGRWQWLSRHLKSAASQQQLQILRTVLPYEGSVQPLLEALPAFEASGAEQLSAAAIAVRYSASVGQRPRVLEELTEMSPGRRRQVAGELVELNPYHFRDALRTTDEKVSRFALQCLLCRWADRRDDYRVRTGMYPQGPAVRTVLLNATEDSEIPLSVRQLIQQWLDATSPKGLQGGFF